MQDCDKKWIDNYLLDGFNFGCRIIDDSTGKSDFSLIPYALINFDEVNIPTPGYKLGRYEDVNDCTITYQDYLRVHDFTAQIYSHNEKDNTEEVICEWGIGISDKFIKDLDSSKLLNVCNLFSAATAPISDYYNDDCVTLNDDYLAFDVVTSKEDCDDNSSCKLLAVANKESIREIATSEVDKAINIEGGLKTIAISNIAGNTVEKKDDGIYVPVYEPDIESNFSINTNFHADITDQEIILNDTHSIDAQIVLYHQTSNMPGGLNIEDYRNATSSDFGRQIISDLISFEPIAQPPSEAPDGYSWYSNINVHATTDFKNGIFPEYGPLLISLKPYFNGSAANIHGKESSESIIIQGNGAIVSTNNQTGVSTQRPHPLDIRSVCASNIFKANNSENVAGLVIHCNLKSQTALNNIFDFAFKDIYVTGYYYLAKDT